MSGPDQPRSMSPEKMFPGSAMPDRDWWAALWPDPEAVLRALGVASGMAVLDLCCGDGYFTAPLALLVGRAVWAVDIDPAMLEFARKEAARRGAPPCHWIEADARDFADRIHEPIDFVLLANTFHGVPDKTGLVRQVARVLGPDGCFAIVNWHRRARKETTVLGAPRGPRIELRMSPDDTRRAVEPAGFEVSRLVELPPYHYGAIFTKGDSRERANHPASASASAKPSAASQRASRNPGARRPARSEVPRAKVIVEDSGRTARTGDQAKYQGLP